MYSGSTLTTYSGRLLGAHQKIDRVARRRLEEQAPGNTFPSIKHILHFEGGNGPDAIKRKSPAHDEPWHYIQPFDDKDTLLIDLISEHYDLLTAALNRADTVRAGFEAAWLAHAIVDGLTPAHHYPYEEKLEELRGGLGRETRTTIKTKLMMPGETRLDLLANNWKMWGTKGLFTTHSAFELGVATLITPMRFRGAGPTPEDLQHIKDNGIGVWFRDAAQRVARLEIYDTFYHEGWSNRMVKDVRRKLAPIIVRSVAAAWLGAYRQAREQS